MGGRGKEGEMDGMEIHEWANPNSVKQKYNVIPGTPHIHISETPD